MRISKMVLVPNEFNDPDGSQRCTVESIDVPAIVVGEFIQAVYNQYNWPEEPHQMSQLLETIESCFKQVDERIAPGTYVGNYVEMGGDENFSVEVTFIE